MAGTTTRRSTTGRTRARSDGVMSAFWRGGRAARRRADVGLGCGTGRVLLPLAKAGVSIVGIDRSEPMLSRHACGCAGCARCVSVGVDRAR